MELINPTPLPAQLYIGELDPLAPGSKRILLVVAKATFREGAEGFYLDTESPFPLYQTDTRTPLGILPRDDLPKYNAGVDLIVIGKAHAPKAVTSMKVSFQIGKNFRRDLLVFGERKWEKRGEGFKPSSPLEFSEMPLSHEVAYGGRTKVKIGGDMEVEVSYPLNPEGKGFVLQEEEVEGTPLPNLENPNEPILNWEDHPTPVFWSAVEPHTVLHMQRALEYEEGAWSITSRVFSRAHPELTLPAFPFGEEVSLWGLTPDGRWGWRLPFMDVKARFNQGGGSKIFDLSPDALVIMPEERSYYICYRSIIIYPYSPEGKTISLFLEKV